MRLVFLLALVLAAVPLGAQRNSPAGIARSEFLDRDSTSLREQATSRPRRGALLVESAAGIAGGMLGVAYGIAGTILCDDGKQQPNGTWFEGDSRSRCAHQVLIGSVVVGPIAASLASSIGRSYTGSRGSGYACLGGALIGTVVGAGAAVFLTEGTSETNQEAARVLLIALSQGTFAALVGRKLSWEK